MSVVAIDFDGVINKLVTSEPGEFLEAMPGALDAVNDFLKDGFDVIIYTARSDIEEVKKWLKENGFPNMLVTNVKISADIYVDDKGYRFNEWSNAVIDDVKELAGRKEMLTGGKIYH